MHYIRAHTQKCMMKSHTPAVWLCLCWGHEKRMIEKYFSVGCYDTWQTVELWDLAFKPNRMAHDQVLKLKENILLFHMYTQHTGSAINFTCSAIYIRTHSRSVKIFKRVIFTTKMSLFHWIHSFILNEKVHFFPEWYDKVGLLKNKQHLYNSFMAQFFHLN